MPTARDYYDSFDKEAFSPMVAGRAGQLANNGANRLNHSGMGLKRNVRKFVAPTLRGPQNVGVNVKPPITTLTNTVNKKNWVTEPFAKHKMAGGPTIPTNGIIKV